MKLEFLENYAIKKMTWDIRQPEKICKPTHRRLGFSMAIQMAAYAFGHLLPAVVSESLC